MTQQLVYLVSVGLLLWVGARSMAALYRSPAGKAEGEVAAPAGTRGEWSLAIILLILIAVDSLALSYLLRELYYDDAFISFRYAKNLADGHGLTWNPGMPPTEGYTNLLLVLLLTPVLKVGFDPLWSARVLNMAGAIGVIVVLYRFAREEGASAPVALVASMLFIPLTGTVLLSMLGMETVLFAFLVFLAFRFACLYFARASERILMWFGATAFLAFLLRPEGVFILVAFAVVEAARGLRDRSRLSAAGKALGLSFGVPALLFLGWKLFYYGDILPNAYYIKAHSVGLYSQVGLGSIFGFLLTRYKLALLGALGMGRRREPSPDQAMAVVFLLIFLLFYIRVDTLMDMGQRFLFPAAPFIAYLALPVLIALLRAGISYTSGAPWKVVALTVLVFMAFHTQGKDLVKNVGKALAGDTYRMPTNLMAKEYEFGRALARFPHAKSLKIAMGDVGMVPYFSGSQVIDTVGLNDGFIARERNPRRLVRYLEDQDVHLRVVSTDGKGRLLSGGHGHWPKDTSWNNTPYWDRYRYAGTIQTNYYNLQLLVAEDYEHFSELVRFLGSNVADFVDPNPPRFVGTGRR